VDDRHDTLFWNFMLDAHGAFVPEGRMPRESFLASLRDKRAQAKDDLWVVTDGPDPIGLLAFSVDAPSAKLEELYVAPSSRGRGVGRVVLSTAEALIARAGGRRASLHVFAANERAVHFYERCGWTRVVRRTLFVDGDQLVMEKVIGGASSRASARTGEKS